MTTYVQQHTVRHYTAQHKRDREGEGGTGCQIQSDCCFTAVSPLLCTVHLIDQQMSLKQIRHRRTQVQIQAGLLSVNFTQFNSGFTSQYALLFYFLSMYCPCSYSVTTPSLLPQLISQPVRFGTVKELKYRPK
jgi:hypothetical protein